MEVVGEQVFWDQLLELIEERRVVPVIGRALLTVPNGEAEGLLYPIVAQRLAAYLEVSGEKLEEGDELHTVACRFMDKRRNIDELYFGIKKVMAELGELGIPPPLSKLAAIRPFKLFVTTTFDSLLEKAINLERFGGLTKTKVFSYDPNDVKDLPKDFEEQDFPAIFHLLGKLSSIPDYAVTQEDILEWLHSLQSDSRQPRKLFDVLSRTNLLILGCSFGDWLARFFIRTAKRQRLSETRGSTDYVADKRISGDNNLVVFLRHFSTRTKIYPEGGALEFIDELHRRWTELHPPEKGPPITKPEAGKATPFVKPGAVFLSYASEDRDAVQRIKEALEDVGVEVFFDKTDLKAGENWKIKLTRSISASSLFIPVISKNTLTRERRFFRLEWHSAIEEAKKAAVTESFIIPVVIDKTSRSDEALLEEFRIPQWMELPGGQTNPNFIERVRHLYREYQKIHGGTP